MTPNPLEVALAVRGERITLQHLPRTGYGPYVAEVPGLLARGDTPEAALIELAAALAQREEALAAPVELDEGTDDDTLLDDA